MNNKQRYLNIDILRIIACFFVVLAHTSSTAALNADLSTLDGMLLHAFNTFGHAGTILFFYMSGMLLLSENYQFSYKKFYSNNFLKLLIAYISWIIIYHVVGILQRGDFSVAVLKDAVKNIIFGDACYHFWYIPMLLSIYLLLPFLRAICHSGKKTTYYFVSLFLIFQIICPTIMFFDFPYKIYFASVTSRLPLTLVTHHVGYFVLGYALTSLLKEKNTSKFRACGTAFVIVAPLLGILGDYLLVLQNGYHNVTFNTIFSISQFLCATGIFILFYNLKITAKEKTQQIIVKISKLTFGVYILHPLFMDWLSDLIPFLSQKNILPIILLTFMSFLSSLLVTWILAFIPIFRKWILFS